MMKKNITYITKTMMMQRGKKIVKLVRKKKKNMTIARRRIVMVMRTRTIRTTFHRNKSTIINDT